jgi:nucleotidyltransferase/DNA polymerase involved in DNA repair
MSRKRTAVVETRKLKDLDGIGPAFLKDFEVLGISSVSQLALCDGKRLYAELCRRAGVRMDPCVEDTLVCAVAQARDPELPAEQRQWWYWSRVRKAAKQ